MRILFQEALGYTAVSAFGFIVDITILWILVHYFSWWYLGAATTSFLASLLWNFVARRQFLFVRRRVA